jgi:hypothetical protein
LRFECWSKQAEIVCSVRDHTVFRFLLRLEDGDPNDPPALVTVVPNWTVGETILLGPGDQLRILAIETEIAEELIERGFNGIFTVEPV